MRPQYDKVFALTWEKARACDVVAEPNDLGPFERVSRRDAGVGIGRRTTDSWSIDLGGDALR